MALLCYFQVWQPFCAWIEQMMKFQAKTGKVEIETKQKLEKEAKGVHTVARHFL